MFDADAPSRAADPWGKAELIALCPGDVLVHEGDASDDVFEVVNGVLEVLRGAAEARIDTVGPGDVVGEIAALAGSLRTATIRATEAATVRRLPAEEYRRWLVEDEERLALLADLARTRIDRHRMIVLVSDLLGVEATAAAEIVDRGSWLRLEAGGVLFEEGAPSDAGYVVASGRLAATRAGVQVGEVGRGELVGEVGLLQSSPRTATVTALRDTTLCRFGVDAFQELTVAHPALMVQLVRTMLARLGRRAEYADRARSIAVALTAPTDARLWVTRLTNEIARHGTARHLWAARVDAALGQLGAVEAGLAVTQPALAELLHDAEATHDYLVLETDRSVTRWTEQALALADRIVVVMSANPGDEELRRAAAILGAAPARNRVERWLALLHPSDTTRPHGTAAVADRLGVDRVAHVREGSADDVDRLARLVSGNATGLVLGGGGARGFAHLGVWRALRELGVTIDIVGGSSIGAPLGAAMALQIPDDELVPRMAELFHDLLDYTVPVVSLVKGERITRSIAKVFPNDDVRDLWLPFFCVSTNLTRSRVEVHDRGDAATAIRASVAIPGVLPPVPFGGDLLVDGGVLNNLPCDVMRASGMADRVIAVDLSPPVGPRAREDFGLSVSGWKALRAQFAGGQSRFPGLMAVLMRTMVAGSVRDRDRFIADGTVDWYLDLDPRGVQLLDFERVAEVAERGYELARPRIEALLAAERA